MEEVGPRCPDQQRRDGTPMSATPMPARMAIGSGTARRRVRAGMPEAYDPYDVGGGRKP